ncbi:MAG: phosphopantothenoylcysteine decarboxylase [Steroidobacteraceae bacterium]
MKVLVTSGATREPIDSVRYISNLSSGRTGAAICEALAARGSRVTQLHGVDSVRAAGIARHEVFTDHASLDELLGRMLTDGRYDAVIHAAAVGDFAVSGPLSGTKLPSGGELALRLRPTAKIIDHIRSHAGGQELTLIGFKLTHHPDPAAQVRAATDLMARSGADYIVQNDVATLDDAEHVFIIHARGGGQWRCSGREALAMALVTLLEQLPSRSPA